jgi:hypothetical protein
MLHTAEAALEGDLSAGAAALLEKLPRSRDATPQDEVHDARPDLLAEKPHQRARREIRRLRNRFNRETLGQMSLDVVMARPSAAWVRPGAVSSWRSSK